MNIVLLSSLMGAFALQDVSSEGGTVVLKAPASPVTEGDEVVLSCQSWTGSHGKTTFFKDGAELAANGSSPSDGGARMTIENVTRGDEGYYRCASGEMQSPEVWLSVRPDPGPWKWLLVSLLLVPLFFVPLAVWMARRQRCRTLCTHWPSSKENLPEAELPVTDPEVTEVQWDLSWMEMSDLLDTQTFPED